MAPVPDGGFPPYATSSPSSSNWATRQTCVSVGSATALPLPALGKPARGPAAAGSRGAARGLAVPIGFQQLLADLPLGGLEISFRQVVCEKVVKPAVNLLHVAHEWN